MFTVELGFLTPQGIRAGTKAVPSGRHWRSAGRRRLIRRPRPSRSVPTGLGWSARRLRAGGGTATTEPRRRRRRQQQTAGSGADLGRRPPPPPPRAAAVGAIFNRFDGAPTGKHFDK